MSEDNLPISTVTIFTATDPDDPFRDVRQGTSRRADDYGLRPLQKDYKTAAEMVIRDIVVAGAVCYGRKLSRPDAFYALDAMIAMQQRGFDIAQDFTLTAMNCFNGDEGDFLKHPPQAQLVVVANIFDGHVPDMLRFMHEGTQSDLHNIQGAWYSASQEAGANAIVAYVANREVGAIKFAATNNNQSLYDCVTTGEQTCMGYGNRREILIRTHLAPRHKLQHPDL